MTTFPVYLNKRQVIKIAGVSRSTIDRLERAGDFPERVTLSRRRVGWDLREVLAWDRARRSKRQGRRSNLNAGTGGSTSASQDINN
jgi:prophage regulatory protein